MSCPSDWWSLAVDSELSGRGIDEGLLSPASLPASWAPAGGPLPPAGPLVTTSVVPSAAVPPAAFLPAADATDHAGSNAAQLTHPARCSSKPSSRAAKEGGGGGGTRRTQPHVTRQQRRAAMRQQREVDQQRIKQLEQQLLALRQQLQSLTVRNKQLKQRQAALNATLEMQEQIKAAAASVSLPLQLSGAPPTPSAGLASGGGSFRSEEEAEEISFELPGCQGEGPGWESSEAGNAEDDGDIEQLLEQLGSGGSPALAAQPPPSSAPQQAGMLAGQARQAGLVSKEGGMQRGGWFFAASLRDHVQWYQQQVASLQQLVAVLDALPPRLSRSLEQYQRYEETLDIIQAVLAGIDDWTIRMAALRPDDYAIILHYNLAEVLAGGGAGGAGGGSAVLAAPPPECPLEEWEPGSAIWQEMVEKLCLTPQQEQTLEAHQALFEQRAESLASSKAAVFAAITDAAYKQDDQTAALELLQGAEALKASLQQDFSLKAPVMISLRKVLTPMQMARLTVDCWPYYTTMKNLSRAHKQRKLGARR